MKNFDLKPTMNNLINTYKEDTIDRNKQLHYFIDLLNNIDGCCSISIDGNWGCGKTFFVKQAKIILDAFNEHTKFLEESDSHTIKNTFYKYDRINNQSPIPQICVYYDAWQFDNDDDPLLSLIYEILHSVSTDYSFKKSKECLKIISSIAEILTGRNLPALIDSLKMQNDPFASINESRSLENSIDDFLTSLLSEQGDRIVIFIDELDRCKPSYAIRLLERIKHYFTNDKITFVFSVNTLELQHTIKQYYGTGFDACKYLDRFFDLRITLPVANIQKYYLMLNFNDSDNAYNNIASLVIHKYKFQLREISRYLHLIKIATSKATCQKYNTPYSYSLNNRTTDFCLRAIIPITIGLRFYDYNKYNDFINGKDYTPLVEILETPYEEWLCSILLKDDETIGPFISEKKMVLLSDKLSELYDAIFNFSYDSNRYRHTIGSLCIDAKTKNIILDTISLLSDYADYSE